MLNFFSPCLAGKRKPAPENKSERFQIKLFSQYKIKNFREKK